MWLDYDHYHENFSLPPCRAFVDHYYIVPDTFLLQYLLLPFFFSQNFSSCKFSCDAILAYTNKEKSFNFNVENNYAYY